MSIFKCGSIGASKYLLYPYFYWKMYLSLNHVFLSFTNTLLKRRTIETVVNLRLQWRILKQNNRQNVQQTIVGPW